MDRVRFDGSEFDNLFGLLAGGFYHSYDGLADEVGGFKITVEITNRTGYACSGFSGSRGW